MRALAMPRAAERWSLTSLREKPPKIDAKVVSHGRDIPSKMAEVPGVVADARRNFLAHCAAASTIRATMKGADSVLNACQAHEARFAVGKRCCIARSILSIAGNLGDVGS
jgi:hypothetical protein